MYPSINVTYAGTAGFPRGIRIGALRVGAGLAGGTMGIKTAPRKCKLCGIGPRELPDRETGSSGKTVCKKCHSKRLAADLKMIMAVNLTNVPNAGR